MKTILRTAIWLMPILCLLASFSLFAQTAELSDKSLQVNLFDYRLTENRFQLLAGVIAHPQLHFEVSETTGTIVIIGDSGMDTQKTAQVYEQLQNQLDAQAVNYLNMN